MSEINNGLRLHVTADTSNFDSALKNMQADAEKAGRAAAQGMGQLEKGIQGVNNAAASKAVAQYERQLSAIQRSTAGLESSFNRAQGAIIRFSAALGGISAAKRGFESFVAMADQMTNLNGRLKLVTNGTEELVRVQNQLFNISQRTRTELGSNVETYTRSAQALKSLGASAQQTLNFVEVLNQAFVVSGATGAEASNALIQLSQGLASGILRGEEFNSIAEQGPRIMQALADSLGVTRGELRKMAEEGQLTSELVFKAILSQAPKIGEEFAKVPRTVGQAMTQLRNQMMVVVGSVNDSTSATSGLVGEIDRLRGIVASTDFAKVFEAGVREITGFIQEAKVFGAEVGVIYNVVSVVGQELVNAFNAGKEAAIDLYNSALIKVSEWVQWGVEGFNAVRAILTATFQAGTQAILNFYNSTISAVGEIINSSIAFATSWGESFIAVEGTGIGIVNVLKRAWNSFIDFAVQGSATVMAAAQYAYNQVATLGGDGRAFEDFKNQAVETLNSIIGPVANVTESVSGFFQQAIDDAAAGGRKIMEDLENARNSVNKSIDDGIEKTQISSNVTKEELEALLGSADAAEKNAKSKKKAADETAKLAEKQAELIKQIQFEAQYAGFDPGLVSNIKRLQDAQIDIDSAEGQRLLDMMQRTDAINDAYRSQQKEIGKTKDALIDFGDVGESVFDAINDAIGKGGSLLDGLTAGFAKIANQLASKAFGKLFGGLFGQQGQGNQNAGINLGGWSQQASISPTIMGTPINSGGFSAPASRSLKAQTDQLAATVTNTVSTNLLGSFLGKGKSQEHLTGLNQTFAQALSNMLSAAPDAVKASVQINSGFRSVARQAELWQQALKKYGDPSIARKWVAPPGRSNHQKGMAADLGYGGNASAKEWFHQNANKYGLAFPLSNEDWHIELASARGGKGVTQTAQAVSAGVIDASKKMATGQAGVSTYSGASGLNTSTGGSVGGGGQAGGQGGGMLGGLFNKQLTKGGTFLGMDYPGLTVGGAIGSGIGGFSAGYQSGSPISGGLTGGLSGFMAGGPVGGLIGLAGGLLGGIFGGRAQRKQKHQEAAQKWAEMQPQYLEWQKQFKGYGPNSGLRDAWKQRTSEFDQFVTTGSAAWKYGKNNSSAQFQEVANTMFKWEGQMRQSFMDAFAPTLNELKQGFGFDGPFLKARDAVRQLEERIDTFIDDTVYTYGAAAPQVLEAKNAVIAFGMSVLEGSKGLSEVATRLAEMQAQSQSLVTIFTKMGLSAEQAASAANEAYAKGFAKLRNDFVNGMQDEINSLNEKGYLTDFRNLIEDFSSRLNDAVALGVDRSIVDQWFKAQAQDIVDGTELAGASLQDLVNMFPQLSGIVRDSMQVLQEAFDKSEGRLREAYNKESSELEQTISRVEGFAEALKKFREDLKIDNRLSTLSPADRLAEAQKQFLETAQKAQEGDEDAQAELIGVTQEYLNNAKEYYATSEGYFNTFNEVEAILASTDVKAKQQIDTAKLQLDELKAQVGKLIDIDDSVLSVADAIREFNAAQAARDQAQAVSLQQYVQALNPQAAIPPANTPQIPNAGNGSGVGGNTQPTEQKKNVTYLDYAGIPQFYQGTEKVVNGVRIVVPDGWTDAKAWSHYYRTEQVRQNTAMRPGGKQMGGIIGAYASGGMVANGIWNQDSVLAKFPNGNTIGVAGGEFVTRATSVTPNTKGMLDYINKTGQLPSMANDNTGVLERIENRLGSVERTIAFGLQENVNATERGNSITEQSVATTKLMAAR